MILLMFLYYVFVVDLYMFLRGLLAFYSNLFLVLNKMIFEECWASEMK